MGTFKGCSALALSANISNKIVSFDIQNARALKSSPDNVEYIIDDCLEDKYNELFMKSKFILLDTAHDGGFEDSFLKKLQNLKWKGLLILDDINLNHPMKNLWSNIAREKKEITSIGHFSGTGAVYY